jgi:hypothetical protein
MDPHNLAPLFELRDRLQRETDLLPSKRIGERLRARAEDEREEGLIGRFAGPALEARSRATEALTVAPPSTTAVADVLRAANAPLPKRIVRPNDEAPEHEESFGRRLLRRALGKDPDPS